MARRQTLNPANAPAWDLTNAGDGLPAARLVAAGAEGLDPVAHMYVAEGSKPVRTLIGMAHTHWYSILPSVRTGRWQPVDSEGEWMLALDCECLFGIGYYQTQPFRLRFTVDGERVEWIADLLVEHVDGTVEAIEVKPDPHDMDPAYRRKMFGAARILSRLGWRFRIRYHEEIRGSAYREQNRVAISGDGDVLPDPDTVAAFDRLMAEGPSTTFGRLSDELSTFRSQGRALAHSMMVAGRVDYDLDALLHRNTPVTLHPARTFATRLRMWR